ncbi:MAG TPA: FliG C-terminal domain-containing protein [Elusimicrobiota bacterium]|nr:FliG C-terminal domain-containing protein [Elusimicrobiota bacterium]
MKRPLVVLSLLGALAAVAAAGSLVEDEIRFSRDLQTRIQVALDQLMGERKAIALVNVQLEISEEMKSRLDKALGASQPQKTVAVTEGAKWTSPATSAASSGLPGFPAKVQKEQGTATVISVAPPTQAWDPAAFLSAGIAIKKVYVKVLLDKGLSAGAENTARAVVANFVGIDPARGDVIEIARIRMPSKFEEALQNPALLSPILQKAATLSVVMLTAMCFFVLGLAALATVRRSVDRLASAVRTLQPVDTHAALTGPDGKQPLLTAELASPADRSAPGMPERTLPHYPELTFEVPADKVAYLLEFLSNEEMETVALVLQHLTPSAKSAFLALLSPEQAGEVVMAMSRPSVVDLEKLQRLKEAVEKHIRGSTGGVQAVVDMLNASGPGMRRQLLESITQKDPALGTAVRERIFIFEDLDKLSQQELARVVSNVQLSDLAVAILKQSAELKTRIKTVLPELTWKVLEEESQHRGPSSTDEKIGEAQDRVLRTVYKLIREGQISPSFVRLPGRLGVPAGKSA